MAETADKKKVNLYVAIKPRGPRKVTGAYVWLLECIRDDGTADPRTLSKKGSRENVCDKTLAAIAATEGLQHIKRECDVQLILDPEYLTETLSNTLYQWVNKWEQNGWKTSSGSDVKDADIWKEFKAVSMSKNAVFAETGTENTYRNWMQTELSHVSMSKNAEDKR